MGNFFADAFESKTCKSSRTKTYRNSFVSLSHTATMADQAEQICFYKGGKLLELFHIGDSKKLSKAFGFIKSGLKTNC